MQIQTLPLSKLTLNTGQVHGLPKNPRFIKDERYSKLVQSIKDDPEMLALREIIAVEHNGKYVAVGGNMRLRALREIGYKETAVKVLPANTDPKKLRAYATKDNIAFGQQDWETTANEWDLEELEYWGMELPNWKQDDEQHTNEPEQANTKIVLNYTEDEYSIVKDKLAHIAATPEMAVWELLQLD